MIKNYSFGQWWEITIKTILIFSVFAGDYQVDTLSPDHIYVINCVMYDYKVPKDEKQTQASICAKHLWKMGHLAIVTV